MKDHLLAVWMLPLAIVAGLVFVFDQSVITYSAATTKPAAAILPAAPARPRLLALEPPPTLGARAFVSAYLSPDGRLEILAEKNGSQRWPLASLTKLFTAAVASDQYDADRIIAFSAADLPEAADSGLFREGESFRLGDLLSPLLVESSNNAAVALARLMSEDLFVVEMNQLAGKLNLTDSALFNPNGLDPAAGGRANYSSAHDLALLAKWLLEQKRELLALTRAADFFLYRSDGSFHHPVRNTNELLINEPWSPDIVGGKTGQTDLAGKNLLLILRAPRASGHLINVVLGSPNHFAEMRELVNWARGAYQF